MLAASAAHSIGFGWFGALQPSAIHEGVDLLVRSWRHGSEHDGGGQNRRILPGPPPDEARRSADKSLAIDLFGTPAAVVFQRQAELLARTSGQGLGPRRVISA